MELSGLTLLEPSHKWVVLGCSEFTCRPVLQVMSFFHYSRKCDKRQLSLPIEPLVGAMRHPFVIPACNPPVRL